MPPGLMGVPARRFVVARFSCRALLSRLLPCLASFASCHAGMTCAFWRNAALETARAPRRGQHIRLVSVSPPVERGGWREQKMGCARPISGLGSSSPRLVSAKFRTAFPLRGHFEFAFGFTVSVVVGSVSYVTASNTPPQELVARSLDKSRLLRRRWVRFSAGYLYPDSISFC